jgi:hypothetical protein
MTMSFVERTREFGVLSFGTGMGRRNRRGRARSLLGDVGLADVAGRPPTQLSVSADLDPGPRRPR